MTRLPFDTWNITPRLDLPPYELNAACPVTGEVSGLEDHHIVRRSFTALGKEDNDRLFWVELPTGEIVGNRINLSSDAHYRVTVNKARIALEEAQNGRPVFYWEEAGEKTKLKWQPPTFINGVNRENDSVVAVVDDLVVPETHLEPGHDCPTCKRRVPIPKKKTSPLTSVFSTRVPIGDKETFAELVDAAAEHHGLKSRPHHSYWTLLYGVTLLLQAERGTLPSG